MLKKYKGIIPAFYACYDEEGNVSPERIKKLAKQYKDVGVTGLYVGGSSGECIYQSVEERKLVIESVMEAVGDDLVIICHVAAPSTRDSIELAKHAEKMGVDAIAAIPPTYFVLSEDAIYEYWVNIMESTNLDFIIYNIPGTTGYALSVELFKRMMTHSKCVGVKNSSMPVQDIYLFRENSEKEIVIFNGPDEQFIGGRVMGADGGIGGTYGVMPQLFIAADEAVKKNNIELAQEIQYKINNIIFKILSCEGHLYSVNKRILAKQGIEIGNARFPLPDVTEGDLPIIEEIHLEITKNISKYSVGN